jgi:hypothetical protein
MKQGDVLGDIIQAMNDLAKAEGRFLGKTFWEIPPQPGSLLDTPEAPQSKQCTARLCAVRRAREQPADSIWRGCLHPDRGARD